MPYLIGYPGGDCGCCGPAGIFACTCGGIPATLTCSWTYNSVVQTFLLTWSATSPTGAGIVPIGGGWYSPCIDLAVNLGGGYCTPPPSCLNPCKARICLFCNNATNFHVAWDFYYATGCGVTGVNGAHAGSCPQGNSWAAAPGLLSANSFTCSPFHWSGTYGGGVGSWIITP